VRTGRAPFKKRYCAAHDTAAAKRTVGVSKRSTRDYDRAWQKLRLMFLAEHPLCQCPDCDDGRIRMTAAEVVDHIEPIVDAPHRRLEWDNLRSMAKICHDKHTASTVGYGRRSRGDTPAQRGGCQKAGDASLSSVSLLTRMRPRISIRFLSHQRQLPGQKRFVSRAF
jgi:5-methylcytosine-specific restriction protein A